MSDPAKQPDPNSPADGAGEEKKSAAGKSGDDAGSDDGKKAGEGKAADAGKTYTQAEIDRLLAKQKKDFEKQQKEAEERAKLSEEERLTAEMADLRKQIAVRDARDAVKAEAAKLGVANPDLVYKLVAGELEYGDDGKVTNLADVLASAKAEFPDAFAKQAVSGVDAGAGKDGEKTFTKEEISKMSVDEINKNWEAIQKAMAKL